MPKNRTTGLVQWLWPEWQGDFTKARFLGRFVGTALALLVVGLFLMAAATAVVILWQAITGTEAQGSRFSTGAIAVALIGAPFVVWRAIVAQKAVDVQEQGHITDRINEAVQGLGAVKELSSIGRPLSLRDIDPEPGADPSEQVIETNTVIEWQDRPFEVPFGMRVDKEGDWQVFTESKPNLEVRIGSIYALERIAQDSDRDHVQIMEILCAYIRQNAPAPKTDDWPQLEMKESEDYGPLEADWAERLKAYGKAQQEAVETLSVREDIQVALNVIGRRSARQRRLEARSGDAADDAEFVFDQPCPRYEGVDEEHDPVAISEFRNHLRDWSQELNAYRGYRLNLQKTDLRGTHLSKLNLNGANLSGAKLQGANLFGTHLVGAKLKGAKLQGARLRYAHLEGANLASTHSLLTGFEFCRLQGTEFRGAQMQSANFTGAHLHGIDVEKARLQGANFSGAKLHGAVLSDARMQGTSLLDTKLQGSNISDNRLNGAVLWKAKLQGAKLRKSNFHGADFLDANLQGAIFNGAEFDLATDLPDVSLRGAAMKSIQIANIPQVAAKLPEIFGDASVTLPGGHGPEHPDWPEHWPKTALAEIEFYESWRKWQSSLAKDDDSPCKNI